MNRAKWTKGICLLWSRGRHFSPSLPDRGPTGIWNSAHSISDPRAEISGILVMVRRSSATSRGTTYWFQYFCLVLDISFAHAQVFRSEELSPFKIFKWKASSSSTMFLGYCFVFCYRFNFFEYNWIEKSTQLQQDHWLVLVKWKQDFRSYSFYCNTPLSKPEFQPS